MVTEVGIEPTKPKGDWFTASETHHLSNSAMVPDRGFAPLQAFRLPALEAGVSTVSPIGLGTPWEDRTPVCRGENPVS